MISWFPCRFTGWEDSPLTPQGEEDAAEASQLLLDEPDLDIDVCYSSCLERTMQTAKICLDKFAAAGRTPPELRCRWRLNERHYGILQGLNKAEALATLDRSTLNSWRSSFDGRPPAMTSEHPYYSHEPSRLAAQLEAANAAHAATHAAAEDAAEGEAGGTPEALAASDVPLTESLADTVARVQPLWEQELKPALLSGQTILLVGHKK